MTWFLPTYKRPQWCQEALDSIAAAGPSKGVVVIDGDFDPAYEALRLPSGEGQDWSVRLLMDNGGVCAALNWALKTYPDEPWYGFFCDDQRVRTFGWQAPLVKAAGRTGFANSADGWQADRRMHGAVVFGGDLLRAMGWWAPPGARHACGDDAWETIGRALSNWAYVPQVMVEHLHAWNGKAEDKNGTYAKEYSTLETDRRAFSELLRHEIPAAIARAAKVVANGKIDAERLMRARSRSVMICTPIARHPTYQYALSLTDTCLLLERNGVAHARQFVIGSSNLPRARNELCARFLASSCTDLLFIDDDMGWNPNAALRLLASDKPIAAVVGRKRVDKPNTDPEVWCGRPKTGDDPRGVLTDEMGFLPFERVGTGFMKIAREAFEAIIKAHPDWKRAGHAGMPDDVKAHYYRFFRFGDDAYETGEDFEFCNAWRELGGEIWVDIEQRLTHVGEKDYTGAFAELISAAQLQEAAE